MQKKLILNLWEGSEYVNLVQGSEYAWICLVNMSQGFKQASSSKYARAQNMARLWICEGYTGNWICLNRPEYAVVMSQYAWICPNNAEYDWVCRHIRQKTVLNMIELFRIYLMENIAWGQSTIYWAVTETDIFRTLLNI